MEIKKYTKEVEDLFIQFFITDPEIFVRCIGILDKDHFQDPTNKKTIEFMKEHCKTYSRLPTHEQMFAITGKTVEKIQEYDPSYSDWCLLEFEEFSRYRQMEKVIYKAPDMIAEGRYGEVEKQIKDAVSIGLVKDLGTDYFSDPIARLTAIRDNKSMISTGWKTVDKILYGGLNRGELTIFCAQSGHGKSIYLQNLAVNYAQQGLNVVYITLELSENLCSMRLDAMTTGYATTEIMRNMEDVALKVSSFKKRHGGTLRIKQLKNNCTSNDIKAYIKEYETQTKVKVDVIIVDYLDLCMPSDIRISPSDLFVKDKYVSENLRALAIELNVILLTASQLNRSAGESIEFGQHHIAGGKSKIDTADNVIAIFTTAAMKEQGRYQLQFIKTRSSSGVGTFLDMIFNTKTLRVEDMPEGAPGSVAMQTTNVLDTLKRNNNMVSKTEEKDKSPLKGAMDLQSILRNIK